MTGRRAQLIATGALLAVTASWGRTFVLIKDLLDRVPPLTSWQSGSPSQAS